MTTPLNADAPIIRGKMVLLHRRSGLLNTLASAWQKTTVDIRGKISDITSDVHPERHPEHELPDGAD